MRQSLNWRLVPVYQLYGFLTLTLVIKNIISVIIFTIKYFDKWKSILAILDYALLALHIKF